MPVTSQKRRPFNANFSRGNGYKSAGASWGEYGECSSVVTLFFAKKSLTKTNRCAGALFWRRKQLLVLHFSGRFLLTASLRRRRMSLYINLFTVTIPVNYTREFRERFEAITCSAPRGDTTTGKYGLENLWREKFSEISRDVLGLTMPLILWVLSHLFLGSKRPRREADHSD